MQVLEFKKLEKHKFNPFALTTDSLTVLFKGRKGKYNFTTLITECLPDDKPMIQSLLKKMKTFAVKISDEHISSSTNSCSSFTMNFLIENPTEIPTRVEFLVFEGLDKEEMNYFEKYCPRFGNTEEQIQRWTEIAQKRHIVKDYLDCPIVTRLQDNRPLVYRTTALPNQFSHGKTDLVIKRYSLNKSFKYVMSEIDFHRKYSHPNILGILDYFVTMTEIILIMEYKNGAGYLPCDLKETQSYMSQLLNACAFMRQNLITHHNLKPDNIIYDKNDSVLKVIDFEFCKSTAGRVLVGNPSYMSPEKQVWEVSGPSSDMYSVGIIFSNVVCHKILSSGISHQALMLARDLISKMTCKNKEERIHPLTALQHEFFTIN